MAPHSSTFAWKIPWTEECGRLQSMGSLESDTTEQLHFHFSLSCIGEGNGNPVQCSCLENPRDGEAWWAAVCGVAQSRTRLKQLSSSSRTSHQALLSRIVMQVLAVLPGLPLWVSGKEPACNAGDTGSIPGLGRFLQEGHGNPLQYSCLENLMNRRAWWATVHGVTKSWTLKRPNNNNSSDSEAYVQTSRSVILSRR